MRTILFRRTLAVAVLFSLMLWTSGCMSYQIVDDWREQPGEPVHIKAKDGSMYLLDTWSADSTGTVIGEGKVHRGGGIDQSYPEAWKYNAFRGSVPADSIAWVSAKRGSLVLTAFLVAGIAFVALGIGVSPNL